MSNSYTSAIEEFKHINPSNDINSKILTAQAENQLVREEVVNQIEAGATKSYWAASNPEDFGLQGYSKIKLSTWDNGKGMSGSTMNKVCNFSASHEKDQGKDGHKGLGAKLAASKANRSGLVWVSCQKQGNEYRVNRVLMVGDIKAQKWGRVKFQANNATGFSAVKDITDEINWENLDEKKFNLNSSWTLKIYCGVEAHQNTIKNPWNHADKISDGWIYQEMARRLIVLPDHFTVEIDDKLRSSYNKYKVFKPLFQILKENRKGIKFETVTLDLKTLQTTSKGSEVPYYTDSGTLDITFLHNPMKKDVNQEQTTTAYFSRTGIAGTFSGILRPDNKYGFQELFDYKGPITRKNGGGNTWSSASSQVGVVAGWRELSVFVSVPVMDDITTDDNRTNLIRYSDGGSETVSFTDYRESIMMSMPQWFKDIVEEASPKAPNAKEIEDYLNDLIGKGKLLEIGKKIASGNALRTPDHRDHFTKKQGKKNKTYKPNKPSVRTGPSGFVVDPKGTDFGPKKITVLMLDSKSEWSKKGVNQEKFPKVAAEYLDNENTLCINTKFSVFKDFTDAMLDEIKEYRNDVQWDNFQKEAKERANAFISQYCIGLGLVSSLRIIKEMEMTNSDEVKVMLGSENLTAHSMNWYGHSDQVKRECNNFRNLIKRKAQGDMQGIKDHLHEHFDMPSNDEILNANPGRNKTPKTTGAFGSGQVI